MDAIPVFEFEEFENNLVYWVLSTNEQSSLRFRDPAGWKSLLISQHDAEDQASVGDDDAFGCPKDFRESFFITSPVQYCGTETPIPTFIRSLGSPEDIRFDHVGLMPTAVLFWPSATLGELGGVLEERRTKRARTLVKAALTRAPNILVVVVKAYDYRSRKLPRVPRAALKSAGFLVQDRV